ncbi:hypothetical protein [Rhizobium phage RHEph12]|nr:hypothetical protein [Rhizobium phage RHEph12]
MVRGDVKLDVAEELRRLSMQLVNIISRPASDEVRTECIALCAINISTIAAFVEQENLREIERADAQPLRTQDPPELCEDEGCPHHGTPHVCVSTAKAEWEKVGISDEDLAAAEAKQRLREQVETYWRSDSPESSFHIYVKDFRIIGGERHERADGAEIFGFKLTRGEGPAIQIHSEHESGLFFTKIDAMMAAHEYMVAGGYYFDNTFRLERWYVEGTMIRKKHYEPNAYVKDLIEPVRSIMAGYSIGNNIWPESNEKLIPIITKL